MGTPPACEFNAGAAHRTSDRPACFDCDEGGQLAAAICSKESPLGGKRSQGQIGNSYVGLCVPCLFPRHFHTCCRMERDNDSPMTRAMKSNPPLPAPDSQSSEPAAKD